MRSFVERVCAGKLEISPKTSSIHALNVDFP